ncbi:MAG TPA: hypothetical protein VFF06_06405 [Polyangia bacterium]|nr:hypothetical protein [Polyangia bacterium]
MTRNPWKQLAAAARPRDDGRRDLVPMIGTGFNARAGETVSWHGLLARIAGRRALPDPRALVGNATFVWESLLCGFAARENCNPSIAEGRLQSRVAEVLLETYSVGGITRGFADQFLANRFRDVVSFNFDYGALSDEPRWSHREPERFNSVHTHARTAAGTRIWYPHGSVRRPESILLGVRLYGMQIQHLEDAREQFKLTEKQLKVELGHPGGHGGERDSTDEERRTLWHAHREQGESWVAVTMNAPLLCLGLGMGREEWPLWWLFNQRARNHARRRIRIPAFVMLPAWEAEPLRVVAELAGLTLLTFDSYDEGWRRLEDALAL